MADLEADHQAPDDAAVRDSRNGGKPPASSPAKKTHHDNMLIIIISVVGVFITYLIYRRSSSASSTSTPMPAGYGTGTVAGAGGASVGNPNLDALTSAIQAQSDANQQAFQGFQGYLAQLDQELQTLSNGGANNPAAPTQPNSAFYDAHQANWFVATQADEGILQSRGISLSHMFRVFDPFASRGGAYAAPTDLTAATGATQGIWFGAAQQDAPAGAPIIGGPTHVETTTQLDQILGNTPGPYAGTSSGSSLPLLNGTGLPNRTINAGP